MHCRSYVLLLMLLLPSVLRGQKEYNIWYFDSGGYGVDFNGTGPTVIRDGKLQTYEADASICDRSTGALLFYTNGTTIWNRTHQIMPNGSGLYGNPSSTQGALIVPDPGDSLLYYVFTADAWENLSNSQGINYSIVDMRLGGGRGDVRSKNNQLLRPATEKLCAVRHCNGHDYWVIAHGYSNSDFYAYMVTDTGVCPPVVSSVGSILLDIAVAGYLKSSPDGTMLALVRGRIDVELFRFDHSTGVVSAPVTLWPPENVSLASTLNSPYGVSFSPDNTKLYTTFARKGNSGQPQNYTDLFQYDVSVYDAAAIDASRTLIYTDTTGWGWGAMQLGPDRKLYLRSFETSGGLAVIDAPDVTGPACGYHIAYNVPRGLRLPNLIDGYLMGERVPLTASAGEDAAICAGDSIRLHGSGGGVYRWSPADGLSCTDCPEPLASPAMTTVYQLEVSNSQGCTVVDSVLVEVLAQPAADAGKAVIVCRGESVQLQASGGVGYAWSPVAGLSCADCSDPIATPTSTTVYTVQVSGENGCVATDTVSVHVIEPPEVDLGEGVDVCRGESVRLDGGAGESWQWSPAEGLSCSDCRSPEASPEKTTEYRVEVKNEAGCSVRDTVQVRVLPGPEVDAGADVSLCVGESTTLHASGGESWQWSPVAELSCSECSDPIATPQQTTTYIVVGKSADGCTGVDSVRVTVIDAESVDAGASRSICSGGSVQLQASDGATWQWSPTAGLSCTDCRSPIASPATTTLYTVTVSAAGGCSGSDTVSITVLPVPAISAGADVEICRGSATQLHATGGVSYQWSPSEGLSCDDCASPAASPVSTTTYSVVGTSADGCTSSDEVRVTVGDGRTVQAHIARSHHVLPGTSVEVPVVLDEAITGTIDTLVFSLGYNRGILRLRAIETEGFALEGWQQEVLTDSLGGISLRYVAAGGRMLNRGVLMSLRLEGYLGDTIGSELPFSIALPGQECMRVATSPGLVMLDSICGLSYRLIELSPAKYALGQNTPNPFNPITRISFSIAFDSPTRLEVYSMGGERVAVLVDDVLGAGSYEAEWDAGSVPSGLYYYRIVSGSWNQTRQMVVVK